MLLIPKHQHYSQVFQHLLYAECWVPSGHAFTPPLDLFCTLVEKKEQKQEQLVVFSNVSKDVYPYSDELLASADSASPAEGYIYTV